VEAETVATAIRIGNPASHERAVRAIRETRGVVAAVTDAEILAAKAAIDAAGVGCEPASAATLAGIRRLVRSGVIRRGQSVVAVLTGHLLKDPESIVKFHLAGGRGANAPVEIEPDVSAVERVLGRASKA
jgi:threonine synthase